MPVCLPGGKFVKWGPTDELLNISLNNPPDNLPDMIQSPVKGKPNLEFVIKGTKYKCAAATGVDDKNHKWSTDSSGSKAKVKCVSARISDAKGTSLAPVLNMFAARKDLGGGKCEVNTLLELTDGLKEWNAFNDGIFKDEVMYGKPIATTRDGVSQWFQFDCDGGIVARFAKNLYLAVKIPALTRVMDAFADLVRTIALEDAKEEDVCLVDKQVMTYYMPWTLDFWLNLATAYGPKDAVPPLVPKIPSIGQVSSLFCALVYPSRV